MLKNASLSLFQTIFSVFALFYSYRFVIEQLGIEKFGLWALLISIVSLSRIAELGLSGSVVKYVSHYLAKGDKEKAQSVIETVTISVTFLVAVSSVLAYFPTGYLLSYILDDKVTGDTLQVLSLAFISSWITVIAGVNKAGLDGCQRYDLSTIAIIVSTIVFVISIFILVPSYSLNGLAFSYIIQGITLITITRLQLRLAIETLPILPQKFSYSTFKELWSYGLRIQVISIVTMLLEPLTKVMLGKYGNIGMIGYYDLASKFVTQMRSLLIAMNQVLVPKISESMAKQDLNISNIYSKNCRLISFISVYFFTALLCLVPLIETIWLPQKSLQFQFFSIIAITAFFINTLSVPAYMINMGTGELRYNVNSHILMGLINLVFGLILGITFGGEGVVIAWGLAIIAGTVPIIYPFHSKNKIPLITLLNKADIIGLILGCIAAIISWSLHYFYFQDINTLIAFTCFSLIVFILIVIPMWNNPTRKIISSRVYEFIRG